MKNGRCLIVSGGDFCELRQPCDAFDYVIACDKGYEYAKRLGVKPDLIIGDFDSAERPDTEIPVEEYPVKKDDTDTMLAARHALKKGFADITICCALGGRFDHAFSNIQTGAFAVRKGARVTILGEGEEITIFTKNSERLPKRDGCSLSVFSLTDTCTGVTIRGAAYDAEDITLTNAFPLGASNAWHADAAEISVREGILMVICSKM